MVILLLSNQDLTPMLMKVPFDGDSFVIQSRFDAYAQ